MVALAHPSDIQTGEGHGVYVFEDQDSGNMAGDDSSCVRQCAEVLQKPSESTMRAKGAVLTKGFSENVTSVLKIYNWTTNIWLIILCIRVISYI